MYPLLTKDDKKRRVGIIMSEKVLKAFIKDKYGLKVVATKGYWKKYYVLEYTYDSGGGTWSPSECDKRIANKLFDCIADIVDVLKEKNNE